MANQLTFTLANHTVWAKVCQGCEMRGDFGKCTIYPLVPGMYALGGVCPFNPPEVFLTKQKVRAGQQKTKRVGG